MKPHFNIIAGKLDITQKLKTRLVSLNITDETGLISDKAEILLDDRDDKLDLPSRGEMLTIAIGYDKNKLVTTGRYIVDEIACSGPPQQMRIVANASNTNQKNLLSHLKAPKSRSWHDYTLIGVVQTIAKEHHFEKAIVDTAFSQIYVGHVDQSDESDIAFLQRLAEDVGGFVKPSNDLLLFAHKKSGMTLSGKPMPEVTITPHHITNVTMRIAERGKYGKVTAKWHNFDTGDEEKVAIGKDEPNFSMRHTYATRGRAMKAATAKHNDVINGQETLELELIGNPNISSQSRINIKHLSHKINGLWIALTVTHQLGADGYRTQLHCEKPLNL
nr:late control protein D [Kangiellaceae bacterium]